MKQNTGLRVFVGEECALNVRFYCKSNFTNPHLFTGRMILKSCLPGLDTNSFSVPAAVAGNDITTTKIRVPFADDVLSGSVLFQTEAEFDLEVGSDQDGFTVQVAGPIANAFFNVTAANLDQLDRYDAFGDVHKVANVHVHRNDAQIKRLVLERPANVHLLDIDFNALVRAVNEAGMWIRAQSLC